MTRMGPSARRALVAGHIVVSVGWIGAAAAYLAIAVAAAASRDAATVRAAWIAMDVVGWFALVPLAGLALATGLWLSLASSWGLFRHYWVVIALVLTVLSVAVLLLHMPAVSAGAAIARSGDDAAVVGLGGDVGHPAGGLLVLLTVAVLNVYKPRGLTRYGRRRQGGRRVGAVR